MFPILENISSRNMLSLPYKVSFESTKHLKKNENIPILFPVEKNLFGCDMANSVGLVSKENIAYSSRAADDNHCCHRKPSFER